MVSHKHFISVGGTMRKRRHIIFAFSGLAFVMATLFYFAGPQAPVAKLPKQPSASSWRAPAEMKAERAEHFRRLLRDPASDVIPRDAKRKDADFAKQVEALQGRSKKEDLLYWYEAGPNDVGGRTRALAVDVTNSDVVIAGGVSGGIWKSTDRGASWRLRGTNAENYSVSALAQDPRAGSTNIWYYASGEFAGNSASLSGASYRGSGLFKSTDNGDSWTQIQSAGSSQNWDTVFDYVSDIVVSPTSGSVFIAANGTGIYRSDDGGSSFQLVLGEANDHYWSDVVVAPNGKLYAFLSHWGPDPWGGGQPHTNSPGVYESSDNGTSWTDITPDSFPAGFTRGVIAVAPSDANILYALVYVADQGSGARGTIELKNGTDGADMRLFYFDRNTGSSEDRSANMPDFTDQSLGAYADQAYFNPQGDYNMVIAVKPDDENHVVIGGTSLFRSTDGFATAATDVYNTWIGGYHPEDFFYRNLHPDVHAFAFESDNDNALWVGHDGGLSYTDNIANFTMTASVDFPWVNKNNGYNVTQFYHVSMNREAGNPYLAGGTQDNGSPYFSWVDGRSTSSSDLSSGDGFVSYLGQTFSYFAVYYGRVFRYQNLSPGNPTAYNGEFTPPNLQNALWLTPWSVDPVNEETMYLPDGGELLRNTEIKTLDFGRLDREWRKMTACTAPLGYTISATSVSTSPADILYFAASSNGAQPIIYKLISAATSSEEPVDISMANGPAGAWVNQIAVNPEDADELLVAMSNYNIASLWHTNDGGQNWTEVEGNLSQPSIGAATILPFGGQTTYFAGTSIGVFATENLAGASTEWQVQGDEAIGYPTVHWLQSRPSDGRVLVGTHGRGMFLGTQNSVGVAEGEAQQAGSFALYDNYPNPFNPSTTIRFQLPRTARATLQVFNLRGQLVRTLVDGVRNAGEHEVQFNAERLASGMYLYRLMYNGQVQTKRMLLIK
jgi:photosystem II stability/assembly factor-like uncharacterized protein